MRKFTFWLTCLFLFIGMGVVNAQSRVITGKVTGADDGLPIPGVTIMITGTTIGTTSDFDGNYQLTIDQGVTILSYSFIGMEPQDIEIGTRTVINVQLSISAKLLDEVIVVAYGTSTKKSFTGSATQIKGEEIQKKNTSELSKALAGEVAGVQVVNRTGQPGTNADIRIRGFGSINASRDPLYIVDGIPFTGDIRPSSTTTSGELSGINTADIASFTILKDASATAIYGSRAANGVVLITTKKGIKGKSKIEVDFKRGWNMKLIPDYDVINSPEQFTELTWEGLKNNYRINGDDNYAQLASENLFNSEASGRQGGFSQYYNLWNVGPTQVIDPTTGKMNSAASRKYNPESWADNIFEAGKKLEFMMKISGGNDRATYYTSLGYLKDQGYYINSDYERFTARSNVNQNITDWLKGGLNLSYTYSTLSDPGQGGNMNNGFAYVNNMPSIYPVFVHDANGDIVIDPLIGGPMYDYGFDRGTGSRGYGGNINPAGAVQLDQRKSIRHQATANANIEAKISKNIKFNSTFGANYYSDRRTSLTNPYYGDAAGLGRLNKRYVSYFSYTWNQILSYSNSFGSHNFSAFIAHENSLYQRDYLLGQKSKLAHPTIMEFNNAIIMDGINSYLVEYSIESYFGQIRYDFDEKYFIHGTIRRDGTSRFPSGKWGTFGSIGLAWVVSNEEFFSEVNYISSLKLKASYGVIGNQALGRYPTFDNYLLNNLNNEIAISGNYKGNDDLTWEQSKTLNFGAELSFGKFLDLDIEYFIKNTDNLLFFKQVAPSLGYAQRPVNDGLLRNNGLEISGHLKIINKENIGLNFSFNAARYKSTITRMPIDDATGEQKIIEDQNPFAWAPGHSIYEFHLREYVGVDPETGESLWTAYYHGEGADKEYISNLELFTANNPDTEIFSETTNTYNDATKKYTGKSAIPDVTGGFGFDFRYKAFELSTQFVYGIGGYIYDYTYSQQMHDGTPGSNNWHKDILARWQNTGDITDVPALTAGENKRVNSSSDRFLTKSSYLNLNNIRLGYTLPTSLAQKWHLSKISIWVAGDNLFVLSNRKGLIPTTSESGNTARDRYVPMSSLTFGVNIQL